MAASRLTSNLFVNRLESKFELEDKVEETEYLYKTAYYNGRQFDPEKYQYDYYYSSMGNNKIGAVFRAKVILYDTDDYVTSCGNIMYDTNANWNIGEEYIKQNYQEIISVELYKELSLSGLMRTTSESSTPWEYEDNTTHDTNNLTTTYINGEHKKDIVFSRIEIITGPTSSGERIVNIYAKK